MIRINLLLLLLAGTVSMLWGQTEKEVIESRLQAYFEATEQKDWTAVVDMVYPRLFEMAPKEDMIRMFEDLEGNGMVFNMKNFELKRISESVTHEGQKYALADYSAEMNIQFTSEAYRDSSMIRTLQSSFEGSYGSDNVQYIESDNSFDILAERSLFAITEAGGNTWFFMENNPDMGGAIGALIPDEVRQQLASP